MTDVVKSFADTQKFKSNFESFITAKQNNIEQNTFRKTSLYKLTLLSMFLVKLLLSFQTGHHGKILSAFDGRPARSSRHTSCYTRQLTFWICAQVCSWARKFGGWRKPLIRGESLHFRRLSTINLILLLFGFFNVLLFLLWPWYLRIFWSLSRMMNPISR